MDVHTRTVLPSAKAIEYMIIDGLKKAESYMKIADRIEDPKKFLHLTDDIMGRIESSEDAVCPFCSIQLRRPLTRYVGA
jgi:hypothetical protein